jgi:hypothetical protein
MIPSLLQIPSAVSDSKLHSVLPNNGKGDFTFDRSTGATRINRDGLIEEVGYFSSELVQNGDFSELGSELVTNGDFATDSNWTKGTGWTIADGSASYDASGTSALTSASTSIVSGKIYRLKFKITTSGFARLNFTTDGSQSLFQPNGNSVNSFADGEYTFYLSAQNNSTALKIFAYNVSGGTSFSIDNVSVKQVDPNDRWTLGGEAIIDNGLVSFVSASNTYSFIRQDISSLAASLYKISIEVKNYVSGAVQVGFTGSSPNLQNLNVSADGVYTVELSPNANGDDLEISREYAGGAFNFDVDNVSVVEVQGDRPRLSYDITNGVVESQPHLLLEPSSTNLVFDSNNQNDRWFKTNVTFSKNTVTSPDGTQNASTLDFSAIDGLFRFITASGNPDTKTFTASVY